MYKVTVLYKHPLDETVFEKYYNEIHLPPAAKIPNVDHAEFTKFSPGPDSSKPEFYRMAELYFVTEDLIAQSFGNPDGQAAASDIPKFATGGFLVLNGKI